MQRPNVHFIGLGGHSSGSGFVYTYLQAHPGTCVLSQPVHFFDSNERWSKGVAWYEAHFASCQKRVLRGEVAFDYLDSAESVERIARTYPQAKLIAVVCNPVERVYREYERVVSDQTDSGSISFADYLERYPESLERGLFGKHLAAYFDLYSPVQLLVLVHDDRYAGPVKYMQSVYQFLEIDDSFVPKALRGFVTIDPSDPPPKAWYHKLVRLLLFPLWLLRLNKLALWVWKHVQPILRRWLTPPAPAGARAHSSGPKPAPISAELRTALNQYYAADVRLLSRLLSRDLSGEWNMDETTSNRGS